ncbi:hypothetical protein ACS0TY_021221 [Phlomoides rotata]
MILLHLVLFLISSYLAGNSQAQLQVGFYAASCPDVEALFLRTIILVVYEQGCEGSILIDNGVETDEKHVFGHQGVRGFDVIKRAKSQLKAVCPQIVSCADILALAARDAVVLANGPSYEVELGRRDGVVSNVMSAESMPVVTDSIQNLKAN